ncbi:MAG: hypothetical protein ACOY3Y_08650 [Acidobacteriota bacterium]
MKIHALIFSLALAACSGKDDPTPPDSSLPADQALEAIVDQAVADQGVPKNSGRICTSAAECAPGDECRSFFSNTKMCVSPCTPGQSCSVPNAAKNASGCYLQSGSNYFCVWFCLYTGKSYECPIPGAYDCYQPNATEPGLKICVPK